MPFENVSTGRAFCLRIFKKKGLPVELKKTVLQAKSKLSTSTGDTSKKKGDPGGIQKNDCRFGW